MILCRNKYYRTTQERIKIARQIVLWHYLRIQFIPDEIHYSVITRRNSCNCRWFSFELKISLEAIKLFKRNRSDRQQGGGNLNVEKRVER